MFQPSNFADISNNRLAELIWRNMSASMILIVLDECQ